MTDQTKRDLMSIPDLYALLPMFAEPGVGATGEGGSGKPGSKPPVNLAVLDLLDTREKPDSDPQRLDWELDRMAGSRRQGVLPTLASWVRLVDGEMWDESAEHEPPNDYPTVATECGFLLANFGWIAEQQWFNELADDVKAIRRDLREATHNHDVTEHLTCIQPGCGWDVKPMDGGSWFKCSGCGESWGRIELHKMAERKRPRPLKECADLTGTPHRTLRYLVAEGELRHVARDGNRCLYDIQDVVVAAAKVKIRNSGTTAV